MGRYVAVWKKWVYIFFVKYQNPYNIVSGQDWAMPGKAYISNRQGICINTANHSLIVGIFVAKCKE